MQNTLERAKFRILIYKNPRGKFTCICYETGWTEEYKTIDEALERTRNGVISLVETIRDNKLSLRAINTAPSLINRIVFYTVPFIGGLLRLVGGFDFTSQSFSPIRPA